MRRVAFWLSLVLIFMIPWENMITTGTTVTTGARIYGLLVAAFWVGTVVSTGRFRKPHPLHVAAFLYVLWSGMTLFWTVDTRLTAMSLQTHFQLFGLSIIIWDLFTTLEAFRTGLQAYVLGACVAIGGIFASYLAHPNNDGLRYAAVGFNENHIGVIVALGIPVAWYLTLVEDRGAKRSRLRLLNYAFPPMAVMAILLTGSRAATIATVPAFLFIIWSINRLRIVQRALIFAALTSALLFLPALVPRPSLERLASTRTSAGTIDLGSRVAVWRDVIGVFLEHPLLGAGSGAFRPASELGLSPHNSFLAPLAELGIIGFGIFAITLVMAIHFAGQQPNSRVRLWLAVLLQWAVYSMTHDFLDSKQTWLFLSFVIVGSGLAATSRVLFAPPVTRIRYLPQVMRLARDSPKPRAMSSGANSPLTVVHPYNQLD